MENLERILTCKLIICEYKLYFVSRRPPGPGHWFYEPGSNHIYQYDKVTSLEVGAMRIEATNDENLRLPWKIQDAFGDHINFNPLQIHYYDLFQQPDDSFVGIRFISLKISPSSEEAIKAFEYAAVV